MALCVQGLAMPDDDRSAHYGVPVHRCSPYALPVDGVTQCCREFSRAAASCFGIRLFRAEDGETAVLLQNGGLWGWLWPGSDVVTTVLP